MFALTNRFSGRDFNSFLTGDFSQFNMIGNNVTANGANNCPFDILYSFYSKKPCWMTIKIDVIFRPKDSRHSRFVEKYGEVEIIREKKEEKGKS